MAPGRGRRSRRLHPFRDTRFRETCRYFLSFRRGPTEQRERSRSADGFTSTIQTDRRVQVWDAATPSQGNGNTDKSDCEGRREGGLHDEEE